MAGTPSNGPPEGTDSNSYTPLDGPNVLGEEIQQRLPNLRPALDDLVGSAVMFVRFVQGGYKGRGPGGLPLLVTQTVNEVLDILYDIMTGRGRSALKSTRSLFELVVTAKDIMPDIEVEERYVAHRAVVEQLESGLEVQASELGWREARKDRRRRQKLRRASLQSYEEAIDKYEKSFKRSWTQFSLATRAEKHGLSDEYDFYRMSSALLHGSSGGALGLHRVIEGTSVHRTGPALALCPLAFLQALRYFDMFIETYEMTQQKTRITMEVREAIIAARKIWPVYHSVMHRFDESLWPKVQPPPLLAVAVVTSVDRHVRWYLHDVNVGLVREAHPPAELEDAQKRSLDVLVNEYLENHVNDLPLLSVAMMDLDVEPLEGSHWEDDRWLMLGQPAGSASD